MRRDAGPGDRYAELLQAALQLHADRIDAGNERSRRTPALLDYFGLDRQGVTGERIAQVVHAIGDLRYRRRVGNVDVGHVELE
jgi:hypothetical protein